MHEKSQPFCFLIGNRLAEWRVRAKVEEKERCSKGGNGKIVPVVKTTQCAD